MRPFGRSIFSLCGATGTGKSKLSIQLGEIFPLEVINSDAVQVYSGLNKATNRVTNDEIKKVPHHLLSYITPEEAQNFNIHIYRKDCLEKIDEILRRNAIPVLTGGTNYYIESVLWSDFLQNSSKSELNTDIRSTLPEASNELFLVLSELWPERAKILHPKDYRKIRAAIIEFHKRNVTDSFSDRNETFHYKRPLVPRYPFMCAIICLKCDKDLLNRRIDDRITAMVSEGLLDELSDFLSQASLDTPDVLGSNSGILQTIGYKEFAPYLALSNKEQLSDAGKLILKQCIEKVKIATKRFANKQVSWIRNRFLRRPAEGSIPVYSVDVSEAIQLLDANTRTAEANLLVESSGDASSKSKRDEFEKIWRKCVLAPIARLFCTLLTKNELSDIEMIDEIKSLYPSTNIDQLSNLLNLTNVHLKPEPLLPELLSSIPATPSFPETEGPFICSVCDNRLFPNPFQYHIHLKSKKHAKRFQSKRKRELCDQVGTAKKERNINDNFIDGSEKTDDLSKYEKL